MIAYNPDVGMDVEECIRAHMTLVKKLCARFKSPTTCPSDMDDLESAGMIALMNCYPRYRIDKEGESGGKFSSFASRSIIGYVMNYMRDHGKELIKAPRQVKELRIRAKKLDLLGETVEEIMAGTGASEEDVLEMLAYETNRFHTSLDAPILGDESGEATFGDLIASPQPSADEQIILREFLSTLSGKRRKVIELMIAGYPQLQISIDLGMSQMTVSRIQKQVIQLAQEYGGGEGKKISYKEAKKAMKRDKALIQEVKQLLAMTTMTYKQIADKTGMKEGTVGAHGRKIRKPSNSGKVSGRTNSLSSRTITRSMTDEERQRLSGKPTDKIQEKPADIADSVPTAQSMTEPPATLFSPAAASPPKTDTGKLLPFTLVPHRMPEEIASGSGVNINVSQFIARKDLQAFISHITGLFATLSQVDENEVIGVEITLATGARVAAHAANSISRVN